MRSPTTARELKKSKAAIDYLKGRGVSGEIAARYGLGYAPDGWQNLEAVFTDYATAPLKDTGLVIDSEAGRREEIAPLRPLPGPRDVSRSSMRAAT